MYMYNYQKLKLLELSSPTDLTGAVVTLEHELASRHCIEASTLGGGFRQAFNIGTGEKNGDELREYHMNIAYEYGI